MKTIKQLIEIYGNEILFHKKSMIKFALKEAIPYNVAAAKTESYQRVLEDLKELDQPPKIRPMSELPTNRVIPFNTLFVLENRECIRFLEVGYSIGSHVKGQKIAVIANKTYTLYNDWRVGDLKIIGWLYELPNPNDIKL